MKKREKTMRKIVGLVLLTTICFFCEAKAQSLSTKVERIEIDGKEVRKSYKVFFLSSDKWIEAEKTPTGFNIPNELQNKEYLSVLFTFGKYKLEFSEVHISKFNANWIVGVDEKPFSEEFINSNRAQLAKQVYYIKFQGGSGLNTVLTVVLHKRRKSNNQKG